MFHRSELANNLTSIVAKVERVERGTKIQDLLEQAQLMQDPVAVWRYTNACTNLGCNFRPCFQYHKVDTRTAGAYGQREAGNATSANDDPELVSSAHG